MKHRTVFALLLALSLLCGAAPYCPADASETDYIVKYSADAGPVGLHPFDVVSEREMRRLDRAGLLEWAEPDGDAVLLDTLPLYDPGEQWNLDMTGADAAFALDALGQGIRVGILDSGVNPHPDLDGRLLTGHNFIPDAADPEDTADPFGHGTRIAGLVAAAGDGGYIGTAPGAEIVPLKVTDGKTAKVSAICEAIYAAIDDYGCRVLNLSLGVQTDFDSLREAVDYAEAKNVVIVSAVGNDGNSTVYYPAGYDTVIGVGAVDRNGDRYDHSNYNSSVFLTAPGVEVRSTSHEGGYLTSTGTSFAVPQAAGAAAVLLGMDGNLTPGQIRDLLAGNAADRGAEGCDEYYGHGILNLAGCVAALSGGGMEQPAEPAPEAVPWLTCARDESCVMAAFSDLDCSAWYHDGVHYALDRGIMNGYAGGLFAPGNATSRAMLVTILWRMEGQPAADCGIPFADVDPAAWYAEAIRWAAAEKIVGGYSESIFAPNDPVTREQFAAILYRYLKSNGGGYDEPPEYNPDYTDAGEVSVWAQEAICWMTENGILNGTGNGQLTPRGTATRAQIATMLMRYAGRAAACPVQEEADDYD